MAAIRAILGRYGADGRPLTQAELMFYKEVLQVPLGHTFDRSPVALQMPVR